jgi:hypothetical protein
MAHAYNSSYSKAEMRKTMVQRQPWATSSRDPISKKGWKCAQVMTEHLPTEHESLNSNPSITKKKKKKWKSVF